MGAPSYHEDLVELWLLADPKCPPGLFYRKALQATLTDMVCFVERAVLLCDLSGMPVDGRSEFLSLLGPWQPFLGAVAFSQQNILEYSENFLHRDKHQCFCKRTGTGGMLLSSVSLEHPAWSHEWLPTCLSPLL